MTTARRVLLVVAGALLLVIATDGPDFAHYVDWASAAIDRNIFNIRGDILSPGGVPYTLWSFEPGLLFALTSAISAHRLELTDAAYLAGWGAAMVFWASVLAIFRRVAGARGVTTVASGGGEAVLLVSAAATFVGTHAGVYSHAYATEVFGLALVAAIWAAAYCAAPWRPFAALGAGGLIALLFLVRPYLVLYAAAPVWMGLALGAPRSPGARAPRFVVIACLTAPLLVAAGQYLLVNRWMTGSAWHAPYLFGDAHFHSVDLWHPLFGAILVHPWHGWLAYHPLYGVALVALLVRLWSDRGDRMVWLLALAAVLAHLWLQSAWYAWWLGTGTFGMRGLAPAAVPLMVALVATLARDPRRWLLPMILACVWSFRLMLDGPTQYHWWHELLTAQRPALIAMAVVVVASPLLIRPRYAAGVLVALVALYLGYRLAHLPALTRPLVLGMAAAILGTALVTTARWRPPAAWAAVALLVFVGQAILFGRLASATEISLAASRELPAGFRYRSAIPLHELRDSYSEYRLVPGFDSRKADIRRYLELQLIQAPIMAPPDRDIVRQIRSAFFDDRLLSDVIMDITAADGIVRLESNDTTREQRGHAVEVASRVPGVTRVDDYMR